MISVCIATYNGEKYIEEQVISILSQLGEFDEIVISDDNSTDSTVSVIENIGDERIKIFYNQGERGYTKNFENSIVKAIGDIIFLSDQDDFWLPGRVKKMSEELSNCDFVVSNALYCDENLESSNMTYFDYRGNKSGFVANIIKARYLGCCIAFNANIKRLILPFPNNTLYCPHDYWISLICEFYLNTSIIKDALLLYRRHGSNVSTGGKESDFNFFIKVKYRLYCLFHVLLRYKSVAEFRRTKNE